MKTQIGAAIHNRFDIEVRDAVTGELKQTAVAFNIVLDQMYTRLCGGSTFFRYIFYGTGTGVLDKTRTALFAYKGYEVATDIEVIKAVPTSSRKRAIVLNPEEAIGTVITEVGIGYDTSSTSMVTHALLQDAEGNQISITKTAADLVTIYATVFATFTLPEGIVLSSMPNNNSLINYLVADGTLNSCNFYLGSNDISGGSNLSGVLSEALGSVGSGTFTSDVANKKRLCPVTRFTTTNGNGHVMEFAAGNIFRAKLPLTGVFTGQPYTGVPIATGDGTLQQFKLPSKNIDATTLHIYLDGVETTAFTHIFRHSINFRLSDSLTAGGSTYTHYQGYISKDGNTIVISGVSGDGDGYKFRVFNKQSGSFVSIFAVIKLTNTATMALSADASVLLCINNGTGVVTTYDKVSNSYVARANTFTLTDNNLSDYRAAALSDDGSILAMAYLHSPYIRTYDWNTGTENWVQRPTLASLPGDFTYGVALSANGTVLMVRSTSSPRIFVYDWNGSAWIKRTDVPVTFSNINNIAISDDGTAIAFCGGTTPYVCVYDWNGSSWIVRNNPSTIPSGAVNFIGLSADGTVVVVATSATMYAYEYSGIDCTAIEYDSVVANNSGGIEKAMSGDAATFLKKGSDSVVSVYDVTRRVLEIDFNSPPAVGVAITADYTTKGIHKTDKYVIDLSFAIQFGEVV